MKDSTSNSLEPTSTIPPDDFQRNLTIARPNEDLNLPHIGLVGDNYTILITGKDTAGRYCLIDMHIPRPVAAHLPTATTSRRCLQF